MIRRLNQTREEQINRMTFAKRSWLRGRQPLRISRVTARACIESFKGKKSTAHSFSPQKSRKKEGVVFCVRANLTQT